MAGSEREHGSTGNGGGGFYLFFFSSAFLSDAGRERDSEGKRSASGDLKSYPHNLLSMDWALASLQQIKHSLITQQ